MISEEEYYTAPSDEVFEDIKNNAIKLWKIIADHPDYLEEKLSRIENLTNVRDNAWYICSMFSLNNMQDLLSMVKPETKVVIQKVLGFPQY